MWLAASLKHKPQRFLRWRWVTHHRPPDVGSIEVAMKIRELAQHWEENAKGRLTKTEYAIHLDVEAAARLAAISEMYPKRSTEELLGELIGAALEELETSFPYIKGQHVIATDEEGDPLYEDVGPTPRFLTLSRRYLHDLSAQSDKQKH